MAGTVRDSVFQPCVLLSRVLKLDDQTLLHLIDRGMAKESPCRRSRNFKWCVEDGGRGVCSSDVHHLVQKPCLSRSNAIHSRYTKPPSSPNGRQSRKWELGRCCR